MRGSRFNFIGRWRQPLLGLVASLSLSCSGVIGDEQGAARDSLSGAGLKAEYFDNSDFTQLRLTRLDATVDFDWGNGSPATGVDGETFSVRWTGTVTPRFSETYTFTTLSDDGIRLWVNDRLIIDNWTLHAPLEDSATIVLEANKAYAIKVEFFENSVGAVAKLYWSSPSQAREVIPSSQLRYDDGSGSASGNGLTAEYFDNRDLTSPKLKRTDATVNFNWGNGAPVPGVEADTFSVRWTGTVTPRFSEAYSFSTFSDDGVRLWVDGKLVVDNWTDHAPREDSGTIALQANQAYSIKLEFYENFVGAVMTLSWASPSQPKEIVPSSQLRPTAGTDTGAGSATNTGTGTGTNTNTGTATNSSSGLVGGVFLEKFDGSPTSPTPWSPRNWMLSNVSSLRNPEDGHIIALGHGMDCSAPPAFHYTSGDPADSFFSCRDHVMTGGMDSMRLTLTPPALLDLSRGDAVLRWDASTLGSSTRDWVEVWVIPYEDDFQITGDFERPPERGVKILSHLPIHTTCDGGGDCGWFGVSVIRGGEEVWNPGHNGAMLSRVATPSASRRDTFELRLSRTHLTFSMPAYNLKWADVDVPAGLIDWDKSIIYIQHAAYSPEKGGTCPPGETDCGHNTWHWDNVQFSPAPGLTVISPDRRVASQANPTLTFDSPAPENSLLRFWGGMGSNTLEFSLDGGATWTRATPYRPHSDLSRAKAFKLPIPAGTRSVRFRSLSGHAGAEGDFRVADPRIVSTTAP